MTINPPTTSSDFLIIGAGIAGLAAARQLAKLGYQVCVLEQAPVLAEIGAGLSLWGAGQQALAQLGLGEALTAHAMTWRHYEMWIGERLAVARATPALSQEDDIAPLILTRAHLHQTLLNNLPSKIDIRLNAVAQSFEQQADGVTVTCQDGTRHHARYVIGADGQKSATRFAIGDTKPLVYSGYVCYRGLAANAVGLPPHAGIEIFGEGTRVGLFALPKDQLYWFAFTNSKAQQVPLADKVAAFKSLHPMAAALFNGLDLSTAIENPIQHRKPFAPKARYAKRVVLVGDAAHPNQPSLGMGASAALSDVMLLTDLIAQNPADIESAIAHYYRQARPGWRAMYRRHNQLGMLGQHMGPLGQRALALSVRLTTKDDK